MSKYQLPDGRVIAHAGGSMWGLYSQMGRFIRFLQHETINYDNTLPS